MDCEKIVEKTRSSIALVFTYKGSDLHSKGSGFVFSKKGLLVTCNHVVSEKDAKVYLKFPGLAEVIAAKVVIRDEEHDIALLKFENDALVPLKRCDEGKIKEGMEVIFSGYPFSLSSLTTHQGILSAIIEDATGVKTYLIDGTVNSGNSGCPLMNKDGEIIGVVNAKRRERTDLLDKVENMAMGAVSLHGVDLVEIYQAVIKNVQLGIGYAIPCSYVPEHVDRQKADAHDSETDPGDNKPKQ
jgi:S1-C subfamily serine protease